MLDLMISDLNQTRPNRPAIVSKMKGNKTFKSERTIHFEHISFFNILIKPRFR